MAAFFGRGSSTAGAHRAIGRSGRRSARGVGPPRIPHYRRLRRTGNCSVPAAAATHRAGGPVRARFFRRAQARLRLAGRGSLSTRPASSTGSRRARRRWPDIPRPARLCGAGTTGTGRTSRSMTVLVPDGHSVIAESSSAAVQSPTSLTRLLRDPLGFVWKYALGWRAPEDRERPLTLLPDEFGRLVHELLRRAVDALEPVPGFTVARPEEIWGDAGRGGAPRDRSLAVGTPGAAASAVGQHRAPGGGNGAGRPDRRAI